ncbi:MAG TPA: ScyD/ScyE family protein [Pedococcus sp.]|jgi:hypothetical protein
MLSWRLPAAAAAAAALVLPLAGPAGAAPTVLNDDVVFPFQLAVDDDGGVFVADGYTSLVSKVRRSGLVTKATGPQPGEVAGLALSRDGDAMAYTTTSYTDGSTTLTIKEGSKTVVADLSGFEAARNPDGRVEYGINDADDCVKGALGEFAEYKGIVESHPYAVTPWGDDSWIVADAAGNSLLKVNERGRVSLLAVLPSQPTKITAEMAASDNLPDCVVGKRYRFEAVPTDVEWGKDGWLYVTTLPGGPEDPSFGARGSVWKLNPDSGALKLVATGFAGATNLAITHDGKIYVAELFAGQVSTVRDGKAHPWMSLPGVVSVEYGDGHLYAGTMAPVDENFEPTGPGTVVRLK